MPPVHSSLYISVPDTRTAFTYCCFFNWKSKTNYLCAQNHHLDNQYNTKPICHGHFITSEEGQCILTRRLCGLQSQSGRFERDRKHSPLPEFEAGIFQTTASSVDRLWDFLKKKKLKLRRLETY